MCFVASGHAEARFRRRNAVSTNTDSECSAARRAAGVAGTCFGSRITTGALSISGVSRFSPVFRKNASRIAITIRTAAMIVRRTSRTRARCDSGSLKGPRTSLRVERLAAPAAALQIAAERLAEMPLRSRPDEGLLWVTAVEQHHRRDREYVVPRCDRRIRVDVHLDELDAVGLAGETFQHRGHRVARAAPRR